MRLGIPIRLTMIPGPVGSILAKLTAYIAPIVAVIVIVILLLGIVRPRVGAIFQLRKKIVESQQKVVILETKLSTLRSFNLDKLQQDVKKAEIGIPADKDLPGLLLNLEKLAQDSGVAIAAAQLSPGLIGKEDGKGTAENFPVKFTITGGFAQIKSFLGAVASSPRVIDLRSLAMASEQASLSASLDLDIYYLAIAAAKFSVDDPLQTITADEAKILQSLVPPSQITVSPAPAPITTGKADPFAP